MFWIRGPPSFLFQKEIRTEEKEMINDYHKNYFWVCPDELGRKKYYFNIKGNFIEVDKDVFNVCYNSYKKQLRQQAKDTDADLVSLQDVNKDGIELADFVGVDNDYIDDIYNRNCIANILKCINELDDRDKELITNLLIKEKTERELANLLNVSQQAIHKRKKVIIKKIKDKLK